MRTPLITCLSYSGGVQSHGILRMVLAGMIPRPTRFCVVAADPGMENSGTYEAIEWARFVCGEANIPFLMAGGPSLYRDIISLKSTDKTRLDTPPLWTKNDDGSIGILIQKCTAHYKIAPIKRAVRRELYRLFAIPVDRYLGLSDGCVEQWIGFTADEAGRVEGLLNSPTNVAYVRFAFPLVGMGLTKADVVAIYEKHEWALPPRSMCNACPFHGLKSLRQMHDEQPEDWQQAVNVDEACRDLTQIGVKSPCYVSGTMKPLIELAAMGFTLPDVIENDLAQCPTGACFT
jgi:hypothetical protein